jgi:hypothetical protein
MRYRPEGFNLRPHQPNIRLGFGLSSQILAVLLAELEPTLGISSSFLVYEHLKDLMLSRPLFEEFSQATRTISCSIELRNFQSCQHFSLLFNTISALLLATPCNSIKILHSYPAFRMKIQNALSLLLTGNIFFTMASPSLTTKQPTAMSTIINSIRKVGTSIFSMEKAIRSFSCDPRPLFMAQGESHNAFRAAISTITTSSSHSRRFLRVIKLILDVSFGYRCQNDNVRS